MTAFKPQQRHLTIRGRSFHFVSYEGQAANPRRDVEASPAMWYLMVEGRRCPVVPCDPGMPPLQLDAALAAWVEDHALGGLAPVAQPPEREAAPTGRCENWWGPE